MKPPVTPPICPYCGATSELVDGERVYPRRPDMHARRFYLCAPCDAYIICHPGSVKPMGRIANAEVRSAQSAALDAFNPIWMSGDKSRVGAFMWLAVKLGIPAHECHIRLFDVATCDRVVELCEAWTRKKKGTVVRMVSPREPEVIIRRPRGER